MGCSAQWLVASAILSFSLTSTQGSLPGKCTVAQDAYLTQCSAVAELNVSIILEAEVLRFHFALDPIGHTASPVRTFNFLSPSCPHASSLYSRCSPAPQSPWLPFTHASSQLFILPLKDASCRDPGTNQLPTLGSAPFDLSCLDPQVVKSEPSLILRVAGCPCLLIFLPCDNLG
jgi:hypothetical protein